MKKFLSLALALIMTLSLVTISAGATEYKDFTDKDEIQYEEAVAVLNRLGIITGYSEGDFRPEGELTRGAAAKIIVSLLIGPEAAEALPTTSSPYPDVPAGNVFAGYISFCKNSEIISGYNDGTFRPSGTLTGFAFSKMLLGALGYDSDIEKFTGSGWTVRVSATGSKANLFNHIDFKGGETVNRETACQLALNTLKATMVQYTGGMNITTSDGSTMVVNPERTYVTSNQEYATHISNRRAGGTNSGTGNAASDNHYTVEFGEEHFKDLRMDSERKNPDQFGRPSNVWSYKKVTIGTYPVDADFTYTTQVIHCVESTTNASKIRALGLNGYDTTADSDTSIKGATTRVWVNGYETSLKNNELAEIADYTDNGTLVEVYVSDEDADFITDVVVVKTQLMEVKRVGSDYVSLDLYDDGSDSEGKPVFGYNSVPIDKKVNDVEVDDDCYNQLKEMKAGDIVAVVPVAPDHNDENSYDVAKVYAPETASGNLSRVETYGKIGEKNAIGVTVGGTAYKIALWNKDLKDIDGETVNLTKKDVTVYLDEYGNALLAKDVGGTKDWMVIKNYRQGLVNGVIVTYVNGWDIGGNEVTLNIGGGSVADYAKANYMPGDLVRYESDPSSNTAEWKLSMDETKGVFDVAEFRDDGTTKYTISASNTTIKLDNFDNTANLTANKDLATIDNGIKFIYVSVDKDGEVDGIEFVNGVKSADNDEIIGKDSSAPHKKNAQACVSLKDGKVTGDSAVKAVVIKRESTDASVSNLLYISKFLGSATRHDGGTGNNNNIVYSYEVVMMGPGGKLVDDDLTIYSYKRLEIGQFARYTKATAPEGMDGVNNDNFYDLRGYGTSTAVDTFERSAAVVKATVTKSLKANKYLLEVADYGETISGSIKPEDYPNIADKYPEDDKLDLGDDKAENLVNARGVEWVDLRDVKNKIDDIDSLKDYVNGNPDKGIEKTPIRVTMLFNDNPDSDDFRRVYLIIIHGPTSYTPSEPDHEGNVSITLPAGTAAADVYSGTVDLDKTYKPGDSFTVVLKPGYKFGPISGATLGVDGTTFTVTSIPVSITVTSTKPTTSNLKVAYDTDTAEALGEYKVDASTVRINKDSMRATLTLTAPEWVAPSSASFAASDAPNFVKTDFEIINKEGAVVPLSTAPIVTFKSGNTFTVSVAANGTWAAGEELTLNVLNGAAWKNAYVQYKDADGKEIAVGGTSKLSTDANNTAFTIVLPNTYTGKGSYEITGAEADKGSPNLKVDNVANVASINTGIDGSTNTIKATGTGYVTVTFGTMKYNEPTKFTITASESGLTSSGAAVAALLASGTTAVGANTTFVVGATADVTGITTTATEIKIPKAATSATFTLTMKNSNLGTGVGSYDVEVVIKNGSTVVYTGKAAGVKTAGTVNLTGTALDLSKLTTEANLTLEATVTPVEEAKIEGGTIQNGESAQVNFDKPVPAAGIIKANFKSTTSVGFEITGTLPYTESKSVGADLVSKDLVIGMLVKFTDLSPVDKGGIIKLVPTAESGLSPDYAITFPVVTNPSGNAVLDTKNSVLNTTPADEVKDGADPVITITATTETSVLGKTVTSDIAKVTVDNEGKPNADGKIIVTGESKKISEKWTEFSSVEELQTGYYVVLDLSVTNGTVGYSSVDMDPKPWADSDTLVWRMSALDSTSNNPIQLTVTGENGNVFHYTIDLSGVQHVDTISG